MTNNCLICNKPFAVKPCFAKKGRGKYCSVQCYYISLKGKTFFKGKKHTKESKEKMSLARIGKRQSPATEFKKGNKPWNWRGGIYFDKDGYKRIKTGNKYILEHRLVVEKHLGRFLKHTEIIHHIDKNITNNHISNLLVCSRSEHRKLHLRKQ